MTTAALPTATVVVPVLNGAATIDDLLRALAAQAPRPAALEVVVVDNGSTDDTRERVRRHPVTLLAEPTPGPSAARNRGLRHARGDVVLHCDADTLPSRRWAAELVAPFRDRTVTLAAGRTLSFPPRTAAERYLARFQLYDAEKNIGRAVLPFVASMNLAVRREAALAVGWDESMPTSEDVDFCTRLLRRFPGPIAYAANAVLFHRNRDSDDALRRQAWTYGEGVADTYARYREIVPWGAPQYVRLARNLLVRTLRPAWLRAGAVLGVAAAADVEYARYHRMWTWWFWRGFFSFRRHGGRRAAPIVAREQARVAAPVAARAGVDG